MECIGLIINSLVAIATFTAAFIALYNSKKEISEMRKHLEEEFRPMLKAENDETDPGKFSLHIKNIGTRPAYDIYCSLATSINNQAIGDIEFPYSHTLSPEPIPVLIGDRILQAQSDYKFKIREDQADLKMVGEKVDLVLTYKSCSKKKEWEERIQVDLC